MSKITVIGSINMDLMMSTQNFPGAGETVLGESFYTDCGGKGANQAIAAAKLGADVSMIGSVGDDLYGEMMCENLGKYHVDTSSVTIRAQESSGVAMIVLSDNDNRIIVSSGANASLLPAYIQEKSEVVAASKVVLAQLEVPLETVNYGFRLAKENDCITVLNPSPVQKLPVDLLCNTDILILNEHEAEALINSSVSSVEEAKDCIPRLLALGVKQVVLTLGEKGCVYTSGEEIYFQPARKVTAVDTTGAGDSFCGALISALAKEISMENAIEFATVVSSMTVTKKGTSSSFPTLEEVKEIQKKEGANIELP